MSSGAFAIGAALVAMFLSSTGRVYGYEVTTHEEISEASVLRSSVDGVLADSLSLSAGSRTTIAGQPLLAWLRQGHQQLFRRWT